MGCGCKGDDLSTEEVKNEGKLTLKGKILKIPTAILLTIIFVIISPILILIVWYISMRTIYGKESNIVNILLGRFTKKNKEEVEEFEDDEFNEDDYEIVGVDIIK